MDLLQIELQALRAVPPDEPLAEGLTQSGAPFERAVIEVLGRVYTTPPHGNGATRLMNTCP